MELATIQLIKDVNNVENSDYLDVVSVLGWKVVTKRNDFKSGDLCIYIALDSILPEKPEFEFMRERHFRTRTIKLRGQISQGLVFPTSLLPPETSLEIGTDVTEILNIQKYEKVIPAHLSGDTAGDFPNYIPKTDEERLQNCVEVLSELKGIECYSTVKIDGTSATFANYHDENLICSRRLAKKETGDTVYSAIYKKYNISNIFSEIKNMAIQGEIAGPGIQKNPLNLKSHELFVFNIYGIISGRYYDYQDLVNFCRYYHLQMVDVDSVFIMNHTLEDLLEMAKGVYKSGRTREGIVVRPTKERFSTVMKGRLSFKIVNNDYKD
jgi:RNA ligase (TIGR02306 family)